MTFWCVYKVTEVWILFKLYVPVCPTQNYFRALQEAHKHVGKLTALNPWAHLLLNHVELAVLAPQHAGSSLGQPFHLGEVQTCKPVSIQPLVSISLISKSHTHVVCLKTGVKALCGAADGSSSTNSCSQIFHSLLNEHVTFPLGRWDREWDSLYTLSSPWQVQIPWLAFLTQQPSSSDN